MPLVRPLSSYPHERQRPGLPAVRRKRTRFMIIPNRTPETIEMKKSRDARPQVYLNAGSVRNSYTIWTADNGSPNPRIPHAIQFFGRSCRWPICRRASCALSFSQLIQCLPKSSQAGYQSGAVAAATKIEKMFINTGMRPPQSGQNKPNQWPKALPLAQQSPWWSFMQ